MTECERRIVSEEYSDFIFEYNGNQMSVEAKENSFCAQFASERYVSIYANTASSPKLSVGEYSYTSIPKLYGLQDFDAVAATGALRLQNMSDFSLDGQGVIVGIIDTGIDYRSKLFRTTTGNTRIISIWDQTLQNGNPPEKYSYGSEYKKSEIDRALQLENPYEFLPHRDDNGHGTFLAGIACGGKSQEDLFVGVAPKADIAVVKLKGAKKYLRDFYYVKEGIEAYQENDIMLGVGFLLDLAKKNRKPLVILLGLGSSLGEHAGGNPLSQMLNEVARVPERAVVACAGNQGNSRLHYRGKIEKNGEYEDVEINVGEQIKGFVLEIWGQTPDVFTIAITSPLGETISQIPAKAGLDREIGFVFENTKISIDYRIVESGIGAELIFLRFIDPTPGVWSIRVYGSNILKGIFDAWFMLREFVDESIYFLKPEPEVTITEPGNAINVITVGAYDSYNSAIYAPTGRGYSRLGNVKPDIIAPGVDVFGPDVNNYDRNETEQSYTTKSGTSVAAAMVAGLSAMFLQWGIVKGNEPNMMSVYIRNYLIRGAIRKSETEYPNEISGYGEANIYEAFRIMMDI